jgi:serine/threonine protein kinase
MPATTPTASQLDVLRADQLEHWRRGERRLVEDYLRDNDSLGRDDEAMLELIYNEVVVREELGEAPRLEEYLARFPNLAESLRRQFELHRLLESPALRSDTPAAVADTQPATPASAEDLPRVPGYDILGVLGQGGMGIVYKARQSKLNRVVALKLVRAPAGETAARFRTEAETAARLSHPNIVPVFECGESTAGPFVALEYVEGGSLAQKINGTPLPPRDAGALLLPLARAVHSAHQNGVVHRDLKPANVLLHEELSQRRKDAKEDKEETSGASGAPLRLCERFVPKITDFGLAKCLDSDAAQTRSGAVVGTPSYMAPEQAQGKVREIGPAADVYALGAVLYEMLTGRPPFKAATAVETLRQVSEDDPVSPRRLQSTTPRDLETICLKCLHKKPQHRYATAQALAEDLERYLDGRPVLARPVSLGGRTVKWAKRHPVAAVAVLLCIVATIGVLSVWAWFTDELKAQRDAAVRAEANERQLSTQLGIEKANAEKSEIESRRQRDEAVKLLEINLDAVQTHAKVVTRGKQEDIRAHYPGEVLFRLGCAYARSAQTFRNDKSLVPEHAQRLAERYTESAFLLLEAAKEIDYYKQDDNYKKLDTMPELQQLKRVNPERFMALRQGRG